MPKKGVQVTIVCQQRRDIDVELMTQAVIALGRELATRGPQRSIKRKPAMKAAADTGARP
jgi:hypothetical protein